MTAPLDNTAAASPDLGLVRRFLGDLYQHTEPDEWVHLFASDGTRRHVEWGTPDQIDRLAERAAELTDDGHNVWHGCATRNNQYGNRRGSTKDCVTFPALWVDIDIVGPNHTALDLPPDLESAHRLLGSYPIPATWIINTGGGIQAWWMLQEPAPVRNPQTTLLLEAWAHTWNELAGRHDWTIDNVWDTPRVMRTPGTINHKTTPTPVTVHTYTGHRYGLDDLDQYCQTPPPTPAPQKPKTPYIGPDRPGDAFNATHTANEVFAASGWTRHHTDTNGDQHWTRPGKQTRQGSSATVYADDGHATIWTTAAGTNDIGTPLDPFGLHTRLNHHGDFQEAARAARAAGYGTQPMSSDGFAAMINRNQTGDTDTADVEPTPLQPPPPASEPFPTHALPDWVAGIVETVAWSIQVPDALPATVAVGVLSTLATRGNVTTVIEPGWTEHPNLYLAVALPPSSGKSPVFAKLTAPLDQIAEHDLADSKKERTEAQTRHRILEAQAVAAEKAAIDNPDHTTKAVQARLDADAHTPPHHYHLVGGDSTPEKIVEQLHHNGGVVAIMDSESGLLEQPGGRYNDRPNIEAILKGFSGDTIRVDRVKYDDPIIIGSARAVICITAQPAAIRNMHTDEMAVTRGLAARFLISEPPVDLGGRDYLTPRPHDQQAADVWATNVERMAARHPRSGRTELAFDNDALNMWRQWKQANELELAPDGDLHHIAEIVRKLEQSTLRIAIILHLADHRSSTEPIDAATVARAVEMGRWWLHETRRIITISTMDPDIHGAERLLEWVQVHTDDNGTVSLRDMQRSGVLERSHGPKIIEILPVVELLVEYGWLIPEMDNWSLSTGKRGVPSPRFEVSDTCLTPPDNPSTESDRHQDLTTQSSELSGMSGVGHIPQFSPPPPSQNAPLSESEPEPPESARHARQPPPRRSFLTDSYPQPDHDPEERA